MSKLNLWLLAVLPAALLGCEGGAPKSSPGGGDDTPTDPTGEGGTSGGVGNTFNHPDPPDVWAILNRLAEEGPPRYSSRVHSCPKMRYQTIGRVLASRGVNINSTTNLSAGQMWSTSDQSLGAPDYAARQRENLELTTASAARLFDIFTQAAPEIIANLQTSSACGVAIFNGDGSCNKDGLSCLIGMPATDAHVSLCQQMISSASSPAQGKLIAVAAIAAAGHTCE